MTYIYKINVLPIIFNDVVLSFSLETDLMRVTLQIDSEVCFHSEKKKFGTNLRIIR